MNAPEQTKPAASGWLGVIDRTYGRVLWGLMALAAIYVGLIMVVIVYITLFRAFDWSYSRYSHTVIEYGFVYILMLGSPWLVRTRGHVYIEIVTAAVSDRVRDVLSRCVALVCVLICLFLAYYLGLMALDDYLFDEADGVRQDLEINRWIVTMFFPIGFGLMAIEFLRFVFAREAMHSGEAGVHE